MYVKTLKPFTYLDNGNLFSPSAGSICNVSHDLGNLWIEDGLAESYNLITPTGTKTITSNGTDIDVSTYAKADVAVPQPEGSFIISENGTYNVLQYAEVLLMWRHSLCKILQKQVT